MPYVLNDPQMFPVEYLGYVDPTDHYSYKGILQSDGTYRKYNSLKELVEHVEERRRSLDFHKIDNLDLVIQNYFYLLGEAPKSYFSKVIPESDHERTALKDIETGARLALSLSREAFTGIFMAGGGGWVTLKEANERAVACINCPKNVTIKKSKLVRFNNKLAALFTTSKKTSYDKELHDCQVCGCPLQEKVHFAAEVIRKTTDPKIPPTAFPENFVGLKDQMRHECWVRKILTRKANS